MKPHYNKQIVIVTGMAGAGMSTVLKAFEDFGFEVFDNFPVSLVEPLLEEIKSGHAPIAIGIDARTRGFSEEALSSCVGRLRAKLLFISCEDAVLVKRFAETRRRHPLAKGKPASMGIKTEHAMLDGLRSKADLVIDTTELSIHELRHILEGYFSIDRRKVLTITLMSFGFRYGIPREADIVLDVRFLKNPHWDEALRPKTGLAAEVGAYIEQDEAFGPFLLSLQNLLEPLLPRYAEEGKSYLTIAIGCTGGRHRSVFTVETLEKWLQQIGHDAHIEHRDINH